MSGIKSHTRERITLDGSLSRLGVVELEKRLEFSPLLLESGLQNADGDLPAMCCVCKLPDEDFELPGIHVFDPATDGDGSTGPTDGGSIR